mmetsp:Transcript_4800/g.16921  ORF Transcript_4800/g.16921 Transcript_4800/m.16921 type:complete len:264 (+) Transcript_4800:2379-3170(+)
MRRPPMIFFSSQVLSRWPPAPAWSLGMCLRLSLPSWDQLETLNSCMRWRRTSRSKPMKLWPMTTSGSIWAKRAINTERSSRSVSHARNWLPGSWICWKPFGHGVFSSFLMAENAWMPCSQLSVGMSVATLWWTRPDTITISFAAFLWLRMVLTLSERMVSGGSGGACCLGTVRTKFGLSTDHSCLHHDMPPAEGFLVCFTFSHCGPMILCLRRRRSSMDWLQPKTCVKVSPSRSEGSVTPCSAKYFTFTKRLSPRGTSFLSKQ